MKRKEIQNILLQLDIFPNKVGFDYITEGVKLISESDSHYKICALYKDIANIYKTTPSRVERSIRHIFRESVDFNKPVSREYLHKPGLKNGEYLYILAMNMQRED